MSLLSIYPLCQARRLFQSLVQLRRGRPLMHAAFEKLLVFFFLFRQCSGDSQRCGSRTTLQHVFWWNVIVIAIVVVTIVVVGCGDGCRCGCGWNGLCQHQEIIVVVVVTGILSTVETLVLVRVDDIPRTLWPSGSSRVLATTASLCCCCCCCCCCCGICRGGMR